jgi:hypothetical protein
MDDDWENFGKQPVTFKRDKRTKRWPGILKDRGGEEIPFTFDPVFWDRTVQAEDRRTLLVSPGDAENFPIVKGDGIFDVRLGDVPDDFGAARGPLVHGEVLAIFKTAEPTRFQVEILVTQAHGPELSLVEKMAQRVEPT